VVICVRCAPLSSIIGGPTQIIGIVVAIRIALRVLVKESWLQSDAPAGSLSSKSQRKSVE